MSKESLVKTVTKDQQKYEPERTKLPDDKKATKKLSIAGDLGIEEETIHVSLGEKESKASTLEMLFAEGASWIYDVALPTVGSTVSVKLPVGVPLGAFLVRGSLTLKAERTANGTKLTPTFALSLGPGLIPNGIADADLGVTLSISSSASSETLGGAAELCRALVEMELLLMLEQLEGPAGAVAKLFVDHTNVMARHVNVFLEHMTTLPDFDEARYETDEQYRAEIDELRARSSQLALTTSISFGGKLALKIGPFELGGKMAHTTATTKTMALREGKGFDVNTKSTTSITKGGNIGGLGVEKTDTKAGRSGKIKVPFISGTGVEAALSTAAAHLRNVDVSLEGVLSLGPAAIALEGLGLTKSVLVVSYSESDSEWTVKAHVETTAGAAGAEVARTIPLKTHTKKKMTMSEQDIESMLYYSHSSPEGIKNKAAQERNKKNNHRYNVKNYGL